MPHEAMALYNKLSLAGLDMLRWLGTCWAMVVVEVVVKMMVDTSELLIYVISKKSLVDGKKKKHKNSLVAIFPLHPHPIVVHRIYLQIEIASQVKKKKRGKKKSMRGSSQAPAAAA